jgi:hypothetical protein
VVCERVCVLDPTPPHLVVRFALNLGDACRRLEAYKDAEQFYAVAVAGATEDSLFKPLCVPPCGGPPLQLPLPCSSAPACPHPPSRALPHPHPNARLPPFHDHCTLDYVALLL